MADSNNEQPPQEDTTNQHAADNQNGRQRVRKRLNFDDTNVADQINALNDFLHLSSEEMHQQRQKAIEKWNFDFENEIPLDGDWKWTKIPAQTPENKEIVRNIQETCSENRTV